MTPDSQSTGGDRRVSGKIATDNTVSPSRNGAAGGDDDPSRPRSDSFDTAAIESIRVSLLERRRSIEQQQANQLDALRSDERHHLADLEEMSADGADMDSVCALVDLSASTLEQIDVALDKIQHGNYGVCEACDQPIAVARLEFLPFAALCVDCQRQVEAENNSRNARD